MMKSIASMLFVLSTALLFSSPAQAGYADGMNQYAGYHIMHGGVDPTGKIGVFFDGAGQGLNANTIIGNLYNNYRGRPKYRYYTMLWPNNIKANINKAHERVCEKIYKDIVFDCNTKSWSLSRTEPIDIFGWSRGGVAAIELADRLGTQGCKLTKVCCETGSNNRRFFDIVAHVKPRVRFLGLIDVVAAGVAQMKGLNANSVPANVDVSVHHRRAGNVNWLDRNVFHRENVTASNPGVTAHTQTNHNTSHEDSGFAGRGHNIQNAMETDGRAAGVPY